MAPKEIVEFTKAAPHPQYAEVTEIEPQELSEKADRVFICDVRRPDEFNGELGHIPGSKMIVLDTIPDHVDELPRDATIVFVCRSGQRSARAAQYALEEGFTSVYNMKGGMLAWNMLGLPTEGKNSNR